MGTVLFAWELGGGLGHVGPMRVLAEELSRFGHRVVFAVRDVSSSRMVLGQSWRVLQAPMGANTRGLGIKGAGTYADIMAVRGFASAEELEHLVRSWSDLIELVKPNLVVADHSPTALLACFGVVRVITVGFGFYLPPSHHPSFPAFRDGVPPIVPEPVILENIRTVQSRLARPAPETVPQLFESHYAHCYSIPELDPYARYRAIPGFGPIEEMPAPAPLPEKPSLFAYLAADHPQIQEIATGLGNLGIPVQAYVRNAPPVLVRYMARSGIQVHESPPSLTKVLPEVSAVISHGGGGITHAALFAGRSQIIIPRHIEAQLTTHYLERRGLGIRIVNNGDPKLIRDMIRTAVPNSEYSANATQLADQVRAWPVSARSNFVNVCNQVLLARSRVPVSVATERSSPFSRANA
jgi:EryCIII-like glycosyltransferase